ncbi:MAG: GNAT family N-acetyltransferase [Actinobacteria bacterium]|nr:GNAT family N-acetyltransferase [Actinomycetota bacterium]
MHFTLRPANETDLPFLLNLRLQTMDQHFVAAGIPKSRDEHMQRVLYRFECAEVIVVDEKPGGLLKLDRSGNEWHLMQLQLLARLQGRGLGTRLLEMIINEARSVGASIRLGVLKANPAHRLYDRLGFLVVRETPDSLKMQLPSESP